MKYDEAVHAAGTALASARKTLGSKHPDVAICLVTLGHVYHAGKQYSIARNLYEQALTIDKLSLGTNSLVVASDLNNVALCHYNLKEYKEAEALFDKSLAIIVEVTGEHSGATTQILRNMVPLYEKTKRPEIATEFVARIERNALRGAVIVKTSSGPYIDFGVFGNRTPNTPLSDGEIRALSVVADSFER
jgi:tetratricopeptide (TPR) repeat protein